MNEIDDYHDILEKLRKEIDSIDNELVELLNKRGEVVIKVGKLKKEHNLAVKQPSREKELIERIKTKSKIYRKRYVQAIWKEILKASRDLQNFVLESNIDSSSDFKMENSLKGWKIHICSIYLNKTKSSTITYHTIL